jgi:hypothetical protein
MKYILGHERLGPVDSEEAMRYGHHYKIETELTQRYDLDPERIAAVSSFSNEHDLPGKSRSVLKSRTASARAKARIQETVGQGKRTWDKLTGKN